MYNSTQSYTDRIHQHNSAIAGYAASIAFESAQSTPDTNLIDELKNFYETEKQRVLDAWAEIKAKGQAFFDSIVNYIKGIFEQLAGDFVTFLRKHGINIF